MDTLNIRRKHTADGQPLQAPTGVGGHPPGAEACASHHLHDPFLWKVGDTMYGSLAHTGVSWPLYALIGIIAAVVGKLLSWFRGS